MTIWWGFKEKYQFLRKALREVGLSETWNRLFVRSRQTDKRAPPCEVAARALAINVPPTERKNGPQVISHVPVRPSLPLADHLLERWRLLVHSRGLWSAPSPTTPVVKRSTKKVFNVFKIYLQSNTSLCLPPSTEACQWSLNYKRTPNVYV